MGSIEYEDSIEYRTEQLSKRVKLIGQIADLYLDLLGTDGPVEVHRLFWTDQGENSDTRSWWKWSVVRTSKGIEISQIHSKVDLNHKIPVISLTSEVDHEQDFTDIASYLAGWVRQQIDKSDDEKKNDEVREAFNSTPLALEKRTLSVYKAGDAKYLVEDLLQGTSKTEIIMVSNYNKEVDIETLSWEFNLISDLQHKMIWEHKLDKNHPLMERLNQIRKAYC